MIFFIMRFTPFLILIKLPAKRSSSTETAVFDELFHYKASNNQKEIAVFFINVSGIFLALIRLLEPFVLS